MQSGQTRPCTQRKRKARIGLSQVNAGSFLVVKFFGVGKRCFLVGKRCAVPVYARNDAAVSSSSDR